MGALYKIFKENITKYSMVIALVGIMIFFQIASGGILLKPLNVTNLILQNSYILILAIGMLLVIVSFQIDLSVGSVAAVVGALSGILIINNDVPVALGILICLIVGALIGAFQGFWIAYVRIPAFITTLAGMLIFRGLTYVSLKGTSIAPFPSSFQKMSTGFIPDFFHGTGIHITTIVIGLLLSVLYVIYEISKRKTQKKYNFEVVSLGPLIVKIVALVTVLNLFFYTLAIYKGIPNVLVLLLVLIGFYTFITTKTTLGRHIYALGGNEKAARLSGVKTKQVIFMVFVNMGILAALSGLVFAARLNSATPNAGSNFELDAIAACFIGGASTAGGIGTIMGAIIGGLVMGVMNNGMSLIGVGIDWQQTIKGLVLLMAVAFDVYSKSKTA
ncbi:multiple monosaccharide ABC transporter permease [Desulfosporosinus sp. BICA1-9]|uniref:multiple monosaccharide ABC transporter permease n=1 Tax=Desulfosporosinus sp. BICA1-9 TaxID=1531958 RepID=UPI00054B8E59|nr:multiple monosaccharide ABC transporter permease [Desulfosporosinus sp. BICA1-9]KJS46299.1 MAG: ABC transporter permease [Peptococcaceae bacterium BRH_c23]KJS89113.1 MAG: ABC transporter permease [Desulfosporosinus sp. BICA1-9]HBW35269.1 sugar ABC transporter permease [Desulfosporosinus sp.]